MRLFGKADAWRLARLFDSHNLYYGTKTSFRNRLENRLLPDVAPLAIHSPMASGCDVRS
jgi:hypothetical protein